MRLPKSSRLRKSEVWNLSLGRSGGPFARECDADRMSVPGGKPRRNPTCQWPEQGDTETSREPRGESPAQGHLPGLGRAIRGVASMKPGRTDSRPPEAPGNGHWIPKSFSICNALLLNPHGALCVSFGRICRHVVDNSSSLKESPRRLRRAQPDRPKPSAATAATNHRAFRDMVVDKGPKRGLSDRRT